MKTGIELIAQERQEQIEKHGYTVEDDVISNREYQLTDAVKTLVLHDIPPRMRFGLPFAWNESNWQKMIRKSHKERLIIAAALIAAEIDRLQALEVKP